MLILGLILNMLGIGLFCWLIFTLAIYALPFFVALSVWLAAIHGGAGITVAVCVAILAGVLTLFVGQTAFSFTGSTLLRALIAAAFAVPAAVAGYHVVHGLSQIGVSSLPSRDAFAWIGAIAVGCTAWSRITILAKPPRPVEAFPNGSQPALTVTTQEG
ncbi:hypothetical protein JJE66_27925 [Bradyrhizobium diazoefficiens]|uniref:hypothetical protein n=1 Tax=Bradyrhizobium diazoefficiens TaxID=1355477 RepID=UPI00190E3E07|nr:hypothetical protein [Bradyrhizobium diazoefficiens]MBK3665047.1 hypothetical protein [Bradyrhizobium diazoefficiens]